MPDKTSDSGVIGKDNRLFPKADKTNTGFSTSINLAAAHTVPRRMSIGPRPLFEWRI